MPLPTGDPTGKAKTPWPPKDVAEHLAENAEAMAWYSGDPQRIANAMGSDTGSSQSNISTTINPNGRGTVNRSIRGVISRFWGNAPAQGEPDSRRHLPTPKDIAILSSETLHSETPKFRVDGPVYESDAPAVPGADGQPGEPEHRKGDPMPDTIKTQERLDALLENSKIASLLLQAAEVQSPAGFIGFRIAFDKSAGMTMPRIVRQSPSSMVPEYVWGELRAVTFWRVLSTSTGTRVYRHLERHEAGRIYHGLYMGTTDDLGMAIPMTDGDDACKAIAPNLGPDGALTVRFVNPAKTDQGVRTAASIPNVLPDPLHIDSMLGRSDFTPEVRGLFDDIDRAYSQFMENVEDAKGRILVSRSMLESAGIGKGLSFDGSQRMFTKLNVPPSETEGKGLPIEKVQFELRASEYLQTIDALVSKAIKAAGFNPNSEATDDARDVTATEINQRGSRTMSTRDKKIPYWEDELAALAFGLLVVDAQEFGSGVKPYPVQVIYPDGVQQSLAELATIAGLLRTAKAASNRVIVGIVHPDWTESEIDAEVDRMMADAKVPTVDPATIGLSTRLPGDAPSQTPTEQPPTPPGAPDAAQA